MRLLYLSGDPGIPVYGGKGASVHVRALVSTLAELGHEMILASPRLEEGSGSLPASVRAVEIPAVRPLECRTAEEVAIQAARQSEAVRELARGARVEAIYERYSLAACAGARAASALGIPLVVEVNAPLREEERRFRQLAHEDAALAAEQETFTAAGMIVAVSEPLAEWVISLGIDPERVQVIENAPPDRSFQPKPPLRSGEPVVVGFSGSLKPWHGIDTLVDAFQLALAEGAEMRLEILGAGPAESLLDRLAGQGERVRRLGQRPHPEALAVLEGWDVGVAPYRPDEGFYFSPLKLVEYMAAGLCPVVSDVGQLARTVEHGKAGVLVPAGDPSALARALIALDRERERLRALGRRAQAVALELPGWRENARRVIDWIEHGVPGQAGLAEGRLALRSSR